MMIPLSPSPRPRASASLPTTMALFAITESIATTYPSFTASSRAVRQCQTDHDRELETFCIADADPPTLNARYDRGERQRYQPSHFKLRNASAIWFAEHLIGSTARIALHFPFHTLLVAVSACSFHLLASIHYSMLILFEILEANM